MVIIKLDKVKKYYGDRLILDIDNLEILQNERIGIVGENGAGKTTLIKAILGLTDIDEGNISLNANYSYIRQGELNTSNCENGKIKAILHAPNEYFDYLSGGEKIKLAIAKALQGNNNLLIADEPTANLDCASIKLLERLIAEYKGALLLVSHDRNLLNKLCNNILEIENGRVKLYKGNYSNYVKLKHEEEEIKEREYEKYISEKQRLIKAIDIKEQHKNSMKKVPKRMGNSEARLHRKMGNQKSQKHIDGNIKALKSRISHLEKKERPINKNNFNLKITEDMNLNSHNVITVSHLNLYINNKLLINDVNFNIKNGQKAVIIGDNACGKTTLIEKILKNDSDSIKLSKKISIAYFTQNQSILNNNKSIIENILESSSYDNNTIRLNLASFGFKGDTVHKNIANLSGGEKVKVALCKVILSDNNTLILDEPTNYLDIKSILALEKAIINTNKTILLVSHDRTFISNICNYIIEIEDKKSIFFNGTYNEYINFKSESGFRKKENIDKRKRKEQLMILENELSKVVSQLSVEEDYIKKLELDQRYMSILKKVKILKG